MATLNNRKKGSRYIQFVDRAGDRKGVPLGRIGKQAAEEIRGYVSALERAALTNTLPPRKTAEWLAEIGDDLHAKLAAVGLVESRERRVATTLKAFLDSYIASRTDLKDRSSTNLKQARGKLVKFFGAAVDIATLNRAQMKDWRRWLIEKGSQPTASGHIKKARQMFNDAVDRKLIADNPLRGVKAGSQANEARRQYIPLADFEKVIEACPSAEWRAIFALARFGGLRTPSETFRLRWVDVDFAAGRILVTSTKTEHHEGRDKRWVPLFPELLPYLLDAQETAEPGATHVVARRAGDNLRTHAVRLIAKAGVGVWQKPFQNMRVSAETDLLTKYPVNWVIAWIGHTAQVQRMHYNTVPDEAFDLASGKSAAPGAAERSGTARKPFPTNHRKPLQTTGNAEVGYPRQGANHLADSREMLKESRRALRWALRRLKLVLPDIRRRDIARLAEALATAQGSSLLSPGAAPAPEGKEVDRG